MANTAVTPKEKLVKVKLSKIRGEEDNVVYISVNERSWRIKRGVEVEVPECAAAVIYDMEKAADAAEAYIEEKSNI